MAVYKSNIPIAVVNVSCNVTPIIIWDQTSCCQILSKPIESYQSRPGKVFCFSALHSHSLWLFSIISPPPLQTHDHWKGKCISSAWSDRVACVCTARWIIAAWNRIICLRQGTGSRRICKDWKRTGESCRVGVFSSWSHQFKRKPLLSMGVIAPPC